METTELDTNLKIRFRRQEEGIWKYALTLSRSGVIISSTLDPLRAGTFTEKEVQILSLLKAKPDGPYRKTEVESF